MGFWKKWTKKKIRHVVKDKEKLEEELKEQEEYIRRLEKNIERHGKKKK